MNCNRKNVLIILTPFHLRQLKQIREKFKIDFSENTIAFHSQFVTDADIHQQLGTHIDCILIPKGEILFAKFIRSPFKERKVLKNLLKEFSTSIYDNLAFDQLSGANKIDIWTGTDKDIFVQLLMNIVSEKKLKGSFIAFDEGIGFYKQEKLQHKVKKLMFRLLSPLLWNEKLEFREVLGTSDKIDRVYVRFPEHLQVKKAGKEYVKITADTTKILAKEKVNKVLFLTAPLSEDAVLPLHTEIELTKDILKLFNQLNISVEIKQHPREGDEKLQQIMKVAEANVLDKKKSSEEINYFDYAYIINYKSSAVLDIYMSGYPIERIITVDPFLKGKLMDFIYQKTFYIEFLDEELTNKIHQYISENKI